MRTDIETGLVAHYGARLLGQPGLPVRAYYQTLDWINDTGKFDSLEISREMRKVLEKAPRSRKETDAFLTAFRDERQAILEQLRSAEFTAPQHEEIKANVRHLIDLLRLPAESEEILLLAAYHQRSSQFEHLCDSVRYAFGTLPRLACALTGFDARMLDKLAGRRGLLVMLGVMRFDTDQSNVAGQYGRYQINPRIDDALELDLASAESSTETVLGLPISARLEVADYEHCKSHVQILVELLKGSTAARVAGTNILLYGPPGTGKTELAKLIAREAGLSLYAAGEDNSVCTEQSREARLADLALTLGLLGRLDRAAVLFDELEDIAVDLFKRGGSKVFMNRLLETNAVPVIWTTNNLCRIDPAFVRRMTYVMRLDEPRRTQRIALWKKLAEKEDVSICEEEAVRLGSRFPTQVSVMRNAVMVAKLSGGGIEAIEQTSQGLVEALGGRVETSDGFAGQFDPVLAPAEIDLSWLTSRLVASRHRDISLCLHGPAGAGKSAYAHYLAKTLGIDVIEKRTSDILDKYVGESEKAIRQAFEEACDEKAFLIFDEADSLLCDRRGAIRSWEISQVNEMLRAMERHPWPFCCTTNLMDRIDTAALRRFAFKVKFDYLDRAGLARAWRFFFPDARVPSDLCVIGNLTPGDFAQVQRAVRLLGVANESSEIARQLLEASRMKPDVCAPIGFRVNA